MSEPVALVVDDDARVRAVLAEALRQNGILVVEAASGREALTLLADTPPTFVLTDIEMPDIDGLELCRRLREQPHTRDVPIIVVTGSGVTQVDEAIAAGCDAVLHKPCSMADLLATIRALLR